MCCMTVRGMWAFLGDFLLFLAASVGLSCLLSCSGNEDV